jgi:serine/threonine protein kinase
MELVEGEDLSQWIARGPTHAGVILGTACYMSPEQARGKPVDTRTDLWAFGCVLYEMITGRQAFAGGDTVSDVVAAILKGDVDWAALPAATPDSVRRLLRRCLEKDRTRRLQSAADARIEIEDAIEDAETGPGAAPTAAPAPPRTREQNGVDVRRPPRAPHGGRSCRMDSRTRVRRDTAIGNAPRDHDARDERPHVVRYFARRPADRVRGIG